MKRTNGAGRLACLAGLSAFTRFVAVEDVRVTGQVVKSQAEGRQIGRKAARLGVLRGHGCPMLAEHERLQH